MLNTNSIFPHTTNKKSNDIFLHYNKGLHGHTQIKYFLHYSKFYSNVFKWDTEYGSTRTQINITNILVVVVVVVVVDVAASCRRCITLPHTEGTLNPSLQPAELPQLYRSYRSLHPSSTPARELCRTSSNSELINGSDAFIVPFYLQKSTVYIVAFQNPFS